MTILFIIIRPPLSVTKILFQKLYALQIIQQPGCKAIFLITLIN